MRRGGGQALVHQTWFPHGTGSGRSVVDYLLGRKDHKGVERAGVRVLRGEPYRLARLVDSTRLVLRYRSGSVNFHLADDPSEDEMQTYLDEHFSVACAGMEADQVEWSAVLHEDSDGSRHIHVVFARVCLYTGLSFNPAAPGWERWNKPLRDAWNAEKGWRRPEIRTALLRAPSKLRYSAAWKAGLDPRQTTSRWLATQIDAGLLPDRAAVIRALETRGRINRVCDDYISITLAGGSTKPIRLSGALYDANYSDARAIDLAREMSSRTCGRREPDLQAARAARERLAEVVERRAEFNRKTYGRERLCRRSAVSPGAALQGHRQHEVLQEDTIHGSDGPRSIADHESYRQVQRERACAEVLGGAPGATGVALERLRRTNERLVGLHGALESVSRALASTVDRRFGGRMRGPQAHGTGTTDVRRSMVSAPIRLRFPENRTSGASKPQSAAQLAYTSKEIQSVLELLGPKPKRSGDGRAEVGLYTAVEALTEVYGGILNRLKERGGESGAAQETDAHSAGVAARHRQQLAIAVHDWGTVQALAPALRAKISLQTQKLPAVWAARLPITAKLAKLEVLEEQISAAVRVLDAQNEAAFVQLAIDRSPSIESFAAGAQVDSDDEAVTIDLPDDEVEGDRGPFG